ncbi:MAG: hypothetical protein V1910_02730 [bacterium]
MLYTKTRLDEKIFDFLKPVIDEKIEDDKVKREEFGEPKYTNIFHIHFSSLPGSWTQEGG